MKTFRDYLEATEGPSTLPFEDDPSEADPSSLKLDPQWLRRKRQGRYSAAEMRGPEGVLGSEKQKEMKDLTQANQVIDELQQRVIELQAEITRLQAH